MNPLWTEAQEKEIYQQIIEAIEQAEKEGQPVREIYQAIQNGAEVQITLEPSSQGKVRLSISI